MTPSQSNLVKVQPDENLPIQNGAALYPEGGSEHGLYVSEELYWATYYETSDFHYEWNNGRLEEKPMPDYAQFRLYLWFLGILKDFLYINHPNFAYCTPYRGTTILFTQRKCSHEIIIHPDPIGAGVAHNHDDAKGARQEGRRL